MKYLVYTDLQAEDGSQRTFNTGEPLQLWRVRRFWDQMKTVFHEHRCVGLLDLGDTLDNRSHISLPVVNAMMEGMAPFRNYSNFKLIGNHEQWIKNTKVHAGPFFSNHFTIIDSFATHELSGRECLFVSFPAAGDEETTAAYMDDAPNKASTVLFAHIHVEGAVGPSGVLPGGIPKDALKGFRSGLLGHIHKHQPVVELISYLGSPFQQDFGESNSPKYVAVFNSKDGSFKRIQLEGFPVYRQVSLKEWESSFNTASEDRYKVNLQSPEEAARFFAHPFAYRAVPVALYSSETQEGVAQPDAKLIDFEREYVRRTKFDYISPDLTEDDMLDLGKSLCS